MGAHLKYKFKKGFLLDEEKLRKIHDIISKRIEDNEIKYSVFREDSFSFDTKNLEDIINEENLKGSTINELQINLDKKGTLDLSLDFDEFGTSLAIIGENRDVVFLLSSELKDYISNEVCTKRIVESDDIQLSILAVGMLLFGTIILVFAKLMINSSIDNQLIKDTLSGNDTNEKINLLIQDRFRKNMIAGHNKLNILALIATSPMLLMFFLFTNKFTRPFVYLFPANLFLFGKEIERYNRRLGTVSKVFWVVFVGLIISIVAGLIVWYITLKR